MFNILDKTDKKPSLAKGVTKNERYKWNPLGQQGEFRLISKRELNIDGRYQRHETSKSKVLKIAAEWDWTLFGAISVADRGEEGLWVVNGGHRTRAAYCRDDVDLLPCLVFLSQGVKHEARTFVDGQTLVSNVSAIDRYRASVTAEDETAIKTAKMIESLGMEASKNCHSSKQVKFVGAIQSAVRQNETAARAALGACIELAGDAVINVALFRGIYEICRRSDAHSSCILQSIEKLRQLGQTGLLQKINQRKILTGKAGALVEAQAVLEQINKGKRNKIEIS